MPAMSVLPTFTDGVVVPASALAALSTSVDSLSQVALGRPVPVEGAPLGTKVVVANAERPAAKVLLQNSLAMPTGTTQAIKWDTVAYDTDFIYSLVTSDTLTIVTPGWYRIEAQVAWDLGAASERLVQIRCNGTGAAQVVATSNTAMGSSTSIDVLDRPNPVRIQVAAYERLDEGGTVTCTVFQDSGDPLNALPTTNWGSWLAVTWDSPF